MTAAALLDRTRAFRLVQDEAETFDSSDPTQTELEWDLADEPTEDEIEEMAEDAERELGEDEMFAEMVHFAPDF